MTDRVQIRVTAYCVVTGESEDSLSQKVNNFIQAGWQPQGGVSSAVWSQKNEREGWWEVRAEYSQAMVQTQPI